MNFIKKQLINLGFGFLAGFAIALGATAALFVKAAAPGDTSGFANFASAFVFTIGLFLIVTLGFYLYTGKIGYVFANKKDYVLNLITILLGNAIGAISIGYFIFGITQNNVVLQEILSNIAAAKTAVAMTGEGFGILFGKGILCGICVFIAVHLFANLKNSGFRYLGLLLPIMAFVLCGFEHCIANMYYFSAGNQWGVEALLNIIYVTVGNSIGSIIFYLLFKLLKVETKIWEK